MTYSLPPSLRFIERDWLSANHIVGLQDSEATVVDTGYVKHKAMTAALIQHAIGSRKLSRIVNTHLHSDHCGANAHLHSIHQCEIIIPRASWEETIAWNEDELTYLATAQRCDRFTPTASIAPGEEFTLGHLRFIAIEAQGHDPKSLIFFCETEGILISADALWSTGFGVLFPELELEPAVDKQFAILDRIEALKPALVLPGHGPMFTDVRAALKNARGRLNAFGHNREKHARNAIKVLLKFLLLDLEKIEIAKLPLVLKDAAIMRNAGALLNQPPMQAIEEGFQEMVRGGHLAFSPDGKFLLNI